MKRGRGIKWILPFKKTATSVLFYHSNGSDSG